MRRLLREPLLHFLALGIVLFVGRATLLPMITSALNPDTVRVTATDVTRLREQWYQQNGRLPDAVEMRALVHDYVDEQLLFQEAKRHGLERSDPVVRQRLVRNLRFADPDTQADDATLLKTAYVMGMADRDPVVRARLIERMRQRIESGAQVSEQQLQDYLAAHRNAFVLTRRYRFRQVYFSRDMRGSKAAPDAQQALTRLRQNPPPAAESVGDPFLLGVKFQAATLDDIERRFGKEFAERIKQAPAGIWVGPVASVYGQHLVRVEAVQPAHSPAVSVVRPRAVSALYSQHDQARLRRALQRLRNRYRIQVAGEAAS